TYLPLPAAPSWQESADRALDAAIAGVAQRVDAERDEPRSDEAQQVRAVRVMHELRECAVHTDCLLRVVLDRGLDQEGADKPEDDHARHVAEGADPLVQRPDSRTHLLGLRVLEE